MAERVETRWYQMFFVWFSANMNVLAYVVYTHRGQIRSDLGPCRFGTGTAGPAFFSLGVRDATVIVIVIDLV